MTDVFTTAKRSEVMSRIKGSNTGLEKSVRSMLHRLGYRFRLHRVDLPGKPDIVLARYRTIIFVHGCFWHRHKDCRFAYTPKSRTDFWVKKLESNMIRDIKVQSELEQLGWQVITVWGCELRDPDQLAKRISAALERQA